VAAAVVTAARLLGAALLGAVVAFPAAAQVVAIGTSPQGTYTYAAGAAIAKVAADRGLQMRVQPYAGTTTLVPLVDRGELDFGLANHLETLQAYKGEDAYEGKPTRALRVVSVLSPLNTVLYVRADSDIRRIADLKGKRLPTEYLAQRVVHVTMMGVLASDGLAIGDVVSVPVPTINRGADDFVAGRTDAFYYSLGSAKVMEANAKVPLRALSVNASPQGVAAMKKLVPVSYAMPIEPGPIGVTAPIHLMAYDFLVLTSAKVPDETVYSLAASLYASRDALVAAFASLAGFAPDKMAKDLGEISYHPGAIKLYRERGLWPPKS
jgi:TRAP transporter TAXI family solute receptor